MVAQIVELIDVQTQAGQEVLNVFHFVDEAGTADPLVLMSDYVSDVLPLSQPLQSTGLSHNSLRWRKVFPATTLTLDYNTGLPVVGTDASDALASCDAASFKWILGNPTVVLSGGFTGHIKRGGCRLAGLDEGNVSGNTCGAGFLAAAVTWAAELRQPGGSDAWQLCVASFLVGNPVPGTPRARSETVTAYTIVSGASQPAPSTQNSRKILRGRTR
jgi:hypothetical protein